MPLRGGEPSTSRVLTRSLTHPPHTPTPRTHAQAELARTAITQPALLLHSVAVLRVLEAECGVAAAPRAGCALVAGHSVGEYAALVAAGALPLAHAARLLRLRGQSMQAAADAVSKVRHRRWGRGQPCAPQHTTHTPHLTTQSALARSPSRLRPAGRR